MTQLDLGTDSLQALGKYLVVEAMAHGPETTWWWIVRNKKSERALGHIEWYPPWRQFVFQPHEGIVLNNTCMQDIASFLGDCNTMHAP